MISSPSLTDLRLLSSVPRTAGPPERQRGSIVREGVLDAWELQAAAQGTDDETLAALREADEEAIPVEHAGVSVRIAIVWATKAGGSAASTTSSGQQ